MKLVREHINEKFVEDSDAINDMGIGIPALKQTLKRYLLKNTLNAFNIRDERRFNEKFNLSIKDLYYLGTVNAHPGLYKQKMPDDYLNKINTLIQQGKKLYEEEHIIKGYYKYNSNIITIYSTDVGKIGTIQYHKQRSSPTIHYFGDIYAAVSLKVKEEIILADWIDEHLNEKFVEDSDPIKDLNIGLIRKINKWLDYFVNLRKMPTHVYIEMFKINDDLTIDVDGDLDISYDHMKTLPSYIKFNHIKGNFSCCFNHDSPVRINGPKKVDGNYRIFYYPPLLTNETLIRKYCDVKGDVDIYKA